MNQSQLGQRFQMLRLSVVALLFCLAVTAPLPAATIITGDVTPPLPWNGVIDPLIGDTGSGTLTVDGGDQLAAGDAYLGYSDGSTGTAIVTGPGSQWENYILIVGQHGHGTLRVEAGGQVFTDLDGRLGNLPDATGEATITGPGSQWTVVDLDVGAGGHGALRVEDGGQVRSQIATVGGGVGETSEATITGTGSQWKNSNRLVIGWYGNGTLRVEDGGWMQIAYCYLGYDSRGTGTAVVTGSGSFWNSYDSLYVGYDGGGSLTVADGGRVKANTLYASLSDLHGDGTITASGAVLDADLRFDSSHGTQQMLSFGSGGTLTVSAVTNTADLGAGYKGQGTLTVADGITVYSDDGYLGYHAGSIGSATISGPGSQWNAAGGGQLFVGWEGSGTLTVADGGQVNYWDSYLGHFMGSQGEATITGAGSKWANSRSLYVGYDGSGTLTVAAGGQVSNRHSYLGYNSGSMGEATITGLGSLWINPSIRIGVYGDGNLRVEDGGRVSSIDGFLGFYSGSMGEATITGTGSKWTNTSSPLYVGYYGSGTLSITDGGLVQIGSSLNIDYDTNGDSFVNMATGGMLALKGDADDSLAQFLDLVRGTDAIRYWDKSLPGWAPITAATAGVDYTLQYLTTGDLAGYTLLTVGSVPEPATLLLCWVTLGAIALLRRRDAQCVG